MLSARQICPSDSSTCCRRRHHGHGARNLDGPDRLPLLWMLLAFSSFRLPGAVATFVLEADNERRADNQLRVLRSKMDIV
jgi:hypothetical protein